MKQCKMIHGRDKVPSNASWGESGVIPRYSAFLFCGKQGCRLDIKVCLYRNCKKLKENDGIFSCEYKTKAEQRGKRTGIIPPGFVKHTLGKQGRAKNE